MKNISIFLFSKKIFFLFIVSGILIMLYGDQFRGLKPTDAIQGNIRFREVTNTSGIAQHASAWGIAWGDINADGWPDLWSGNHGAGTSLYLNLGNGTFKDIAPQVIPSSKGVKPGIDVHGVAWADFDNDGDQDLLEVVGGEKGFGYGSNHLFVNQGNKLEEKAVALGLDYPLGRGRSPLWFDWDKDGRLDVLLLNSKRRDNKNAPSALFKQTDRGFIDVSKKVSIKLRDESLFAQLLGSKENTFLIIHGFRYPYRTYDIHKIPFQEVSQKLGLLKPFNNGYFGDIKPRISNTSDVTIGDFDGDLNLDLYVVRKKSPTDEIVQPSPKRIEVGLGVKAKDKKGITFKSDSNEINFNFQQKNWPAKNILIGSDGHHPHKIPFTLSTKNPRNFGLSEPVKGNKAVYIGYNPDQKKWQVYASSPISDKHIISIESPKLPLFDVSPINFKPFKNLKGHNRLLMNYGREKYPYFSDKSSNSGLDERTDCKSVASGDFDNDMDLDLYLVCSRSISNLDNILYENQGNGTFAKVLEAGGASGLKFAIGDSVAVSDYNQDGFLDLFVTNIQIFSQGRFQLFQGQRNNNHWLQIDLKGVKSNRDGIGSQIFVNAGNITQLRFHDGGMHRHAQNYKRIHFGLGNKTLIEKLEVQWPSGIKQEVCNVNVDQIVVVTEKDTRC
jgi:hypothetical protein